MALAYIDFHTHKHNKNDACIAIESFDPSENNLPVGIKNLHTLGVHPWNASKGDIEKYGRAIKESAADRQMVGIGEIGIDKLHAPDLSTQTKIFEHQLNIAYQINKPITIHCVKAWDELLAIKEKYDSSAPWAIHGFNGSAQLAKQLTSKGFYLSVGAAILNKKSKLHEAIHSIPLNRLFLETDTSHLGIEQVYAAVSSKLGITTDELMQIITENFCHFFNRSPW